MKRASGELMWLEMTIGHPYHDDVIEWKHFSRNWNFVRGIHRSPVNSIHKGQWRGALLFSLTFAWTNGWVNNRDAGDLGRQCAHYDATVMYLSHLGATAKTYPNHSVVKVWQRLYIFSVHYHHHDVTTGIRDAFGIIGFCEANPPVTGGFSQKVQ